MVSQPTDTFTERVNRLMKRNALSKKDMANKLNVDYSTFWRKLNGKRNVDIPVLMQIAGILGTSVSYLVGETNNPMPPEPLSTENEVLNDVLPLADESSKETLHQEKPGYLKFSQGNCYIEVPDTPSNQTWFRELATSVLMTELTVGVPA